VHSFVNTTDKLCSSTENISGRFYRVFVSIAHMLFLNGWRSSWPIQVACLRKLPVMTHQEIILCKDFLIEFVPIFNIEELVLRIGAIAGHQWSLFSSRPHCGFLYATTSGNTILFEFNIMDGSQFKNSREKQSRQKCSHLECIALEKRMYS